MSPSSPDAAPAVREQLRTIARVLREVHPLSLDLQRLLAGLLEELADALAAEKVSPASLSRLTESMAHLAEAVHHQKERHLVSGLREGMERAVVEVEAHYPNLAGLARKLMDTLTNIGI